MQVNLNISESVCDNISEHNETQVKAQKIVSTIQVTRIHQFLPIPAVF